MPDHPGEWRRVLKMLAGSPEGVTGSPMPAAKRWGADHAQRPLPRSADDARQHAGAGRALAVIVCAHCHHEVVKIAQ